MRFLSLLLSLLIIQTIVTCGMIYYFVRENYTILVQYGGLEKDVIQTLYGELNILIAGIIGAFILFFVGTALIGIIFSHRIAGPIYAIKRTVRDVLAGRDVELQFRNRDEFKELVDSFNEMVRQLRRGEIETFRPKVVNG